MVGTEARGFLFGAPVALGLGVGFVPVRKPVSFRVKLLLRPGELEYGTDQLEIHVDAIKPAIKCWLWTTCWQLAARLKRP